MIKENGEIDPPLRCPTCPLSCGCSWDCLRGDDLAEIASLRAALSEIAQEEKVYLGHGDYTIVPSCSAEEAQSIAVRALTKDHP